MCPEITLKPEWQVMRPKRPVGRPVNPPEKMGYQHYAGNILPGMRPSCRAQGCKKHLRISQALWCSDDCQQRGMGYLNGILSKLNEQEIEELLRNNLSLDFRVIKVNREITKKKRPRRRPNYEIPNFTG